MRSRTPWACWALLAGALALLAPPAAAAQGHALPVTEVKPEVDLRGVPTTVFEQLGKLYGVRVQVAPDFPARPVQLHLEEADFAAALQVAAQLTDAFWVMQPDGGIFVAANTPENHQRYESKVLKTIALPGRTPDALNEAARLLRDVLDLQLVRFDLQAGSVQVFDTPWRVTVAEQLLRQLPGDPGELMVEVLLLEVDREKAQELGLVPPDQVIAVHLGAGALAVQDADSLLEAIQFLLQRGLLPQALLGTSLQSLLSAGAIDPGQLGALLPPFILAGGGGTTYALLLPSLELRLSQLARVTRSWRRLQVRARGGQEADLFIGERFPIVFATFSAIFIPEIVQELIRRGQFIPPVPAVRYEDLGLRVKVTPHVHSAREITLEMKFEQKALTGQEVNGIPVIANRELEQQVRLREGETLIVAGLRRETHERTRLGAPGLSRLPVIGALFRRTSPRTQTTELLLVVTPRLVRLPASEYLAARSLYVGTEKEFSPAGPPSAAPGAPLPGEPPPTQPPRPQEQPPPPPQSQPPQR